MYCSCIRYRLERVRVQRAAPPGECVLFWGRAQSVRRPRTFINLCHNYTAVEQHQQCWIYPPTTRSLPACVCVCVCVCVCSSGCGSSSGHLLLLPDPPAACSTSLTCNWALLLHVHSSVGGPLHDHSNHEVPNKSWKVDIPFWVDQPLWCSTYNDS